MIRKVLYLVIACFAILMLFFDGMFVLHEMDNEKRLYKDQVNLSTGGGIGVYVVNLKQHKERYEKTYSQLKHLGLPIFRIEGVDGANLSDDEIRGHLDTASYTSYMGHNPRKGTVGCYLSHLKAWKNFLESDHDFALIVEDDIEFDPEVLQATIYELIKNKNLWNINLLEIHHNGMPVTLKELGKSGKSLNIYLLRVSHTGAYLMDRYAAYSLLNKALPIKMPIDHYFIRSWELGNLVITGVEPRLVVQINEKFNDSYRKGTEYCENKKRNDVPLIASVHHFVYTVKSDLARIAYNLFQYIVLNYWINNNDTSA